MYFAVWATDREGTQDKRLAVRDAHRARLREPGSHRVKVVLGGPTLTESNAAMNGSLLVIEADDVDAVRRFVAEDPYQVTGVYASVDIRPWRWGLGAPA
ncbi:MAG: YciI family protein [Pseudomonadota bacterium]|nr:YciI family protein [Pseudomonadota bacterium]